VCEQLMMGLARSSVAAERQLSRALAASARSLPNDTDEWVRLFLSCVSELDQVAVLVCDTTLATCPILCANLGFQIMTGYTAENVVGRSCRFMQGPRSDKSAICTLRHAMQSGTRTDVRLINYREDGTPFLNMLSLRPVYDCERGYRFMISISVEVSDAFSQMKPRLMQMDRLLKLLPETLSLPSPPAAAARIALVADAVIATRRKAEREAAARAAETEARRAEDEATRIEAMKTGADKLIDKLSSGPRLYERMGAATNAALQRNTPGKGAVVPIKPVQPRIPRPRQLSESRPRSAAPRLGGGGVAAMKQKVAEMTGAVDNSFRLLNGHSSSARARALISPRANSRRPSDSHADAMLPRVAKAQPQPDEATRTVDIVRGPRKALDAFRLSDGSGAMFGIGPPQPPTTQPPAAHSRKNSMMYKQCAREESCSATTAAIGEDGERCGPDKMSRGSSSTLSLQSSRDVQAADSEEHWRSNTMAYTQNMPVVVAAPSFEALAAASVGELLIPPSLPVGASTLNDVSASVIKRIATVERTSKLPDEFWNNAVLETIFQRDAYGATASASCSTAQDSVSPHVSPMTVTASSREVTEQRAAHDAQASSSADFTEHSGGRVETSRNAMSVKGTNQSMVVAPTRSCAALERGTTAIPPPLELPRACMAAASR